MKYSISSYSFNKLIATGNITQIDCISKAKEMGFDAIEFVDILAPNNISKQEYATLLAKECRDANMPISCFTFGADFLNNNTEEEIKWVKSMIDIASILGVKLVRHDATIGDGRDFDTVLPILADACRQVTIYAAEKGIKTMVENHGFFCQDSKRVEMLYHAVSHPNFGLLADMGNFLCVDEEPKCAFKRVIPYASYVHAKDFYVKSVKEPNPGEGYFKSRGGNYLKGTIIGHGNVPVVDCLNIIKEAKYDGYIAIEFEGMEDTLSAIEIGFSNLKRYINNYIGGVK